MGKVNILEETTKNPITLIGKMSGLCYGSDVSDDIKNYKRGLNCIKAGHGRTIEFPDVYMHIDGYSARVIRELYTHIGGAPTRLQESTRYINYSKFDYITPPSVIKNGCEGMYKDAILKISETIYDMIKNGVPVEDASMLLPLGMATGVSVKYNARTLSTMSEQRLCTRAYWEYRDLMKEIIKELKEYSDEWAILCDLIFKCKCDKLLYCPEHNSCGKYNKIEE